MTTTADELKPEIIELPNGWFFRGKPWSNADYVLFDPNEFWMEGRSMWCAEDAIAFADAMNKANRNTAQAVQEAVAKKMQYIGYAIARLEDNELDQALNALKQARGDATPTDLIQEAVAEHVMVLEDAYDLLQDYLDDAKKVRHPITGEMVNTMQMVNTRTTLAAITKLKGAK